MKSSDNACSSQSCLCAFTRSTDEADKQRYQETHAVLSMATLNGANELCQDPNSLSLVRNFLQAN
jgi:hypothetical protein